MFRMPTTAEQWSTRRRTSSVLVLLLMVQLLVVQLGVVTSSTTAAPSTTPTGVTATKSSMGRRRAACAVETEHQAPLYPSLAPKPRTRPLLRPQQQQPHHWLHIASPFTAAASPRTTTTTMSGEFVVAARRRRSRIVQRDKVIFSCLLTASAGFVNLRSLHDYGALVNICSGNLMRLGSMVASRLAGSLSSRSSSAQTTTTTNNVWIPLAVLLGYVGGTGVTRWFHHILTRQANNAYDGTDADAPTTSTASFSVLSTTATTTRKLLVAVTPLILACFVLADILSIVPPSRLARAGHVLCQAVAYGMIHLAASDAAGGMVLFAITGYVASVTKASVDTVQHQQHHRQYQDTSTTATAVATSSFLMSPATVHHACMVVSFFGGSVLGSWLWDHVLDNYYTNSGSSSTSITASVRWIPVQTLTGLFYAAVFVWYGNRPAVDEPSVERRQHSTAGHPRDRHD